MVSASPNDQKYPSYQLVLKLNVICKKKIDERASIIAVIYIMHNKFSKFLCFASFCAHLCAISNNFNRNGENLILGT